MNRVILVFPEPDDEQIDKISPPLSILYVGSFLENAGVSVSYIDLRIDSLQDFYKELDKDPILVGVSSMTGYQLIGAVEVLKSVRERKPEVLTVLGGIHASLMPEQSLYSPLVDFIVIGEGEYNLLELLEMLDSSDPDFSKILGIGWKKKDGSIIINPPRPFMDLAKSTPPITDSSKHLYKFYPHGKVQIARGCPHRCAFCYNTSFNRRRIRKKPLQNIEHEIEVIKNYLPEIKHFTLLADNFGPEKKRIVDIAKLTSKYDFKFFTSIRAEYLDEKLVQDIEDQCDSVLIGVEHVVPRIRKFLLKDNEVEDVRRAANILAGSKIKVYHSFMSGFPGETKAETIANMDFADELKALDKQKAIILPFFLCTAFPGTELYKRALDEGFEEPKSLEKWRDFRFGEINMPWINKEHEYFTDLYGISMLTYLKSESYNSNLFEKEFFIYFSEKASEKWEKRNLEFKKEWRLFTIYNREIKRTRFMENLKLKRKSFSD